MTHVAGARVCGESDVSDITSFTRLRSSSAILSTKRGRDENNENNDKTGSQESDAPRTKGLRVELASKRVKVDEQAPKDTHSTLRYQIDTSMSTANSQFGASVGLQSWQDPATEYHNRLLPRVEAVSLDVKWPSELSHGDGSFHSTNGTTGLDPVTAALNSESGLHTAAGRDSAIELDSEYEVESSRESSVSVAGDDQRIPEWKYIGGW